MPRENRKRGKKHKAKSPEHPAAEEDDGADYATFHSQHVSHPSPEISNVEHTSDASFGPLDPDVKAYFKTIDDQLRDWQEQGVNAQAEIEMDPNEERRLFFAAALSEMHGKELQLATDPDCSPILERMLYSMDDFVRRVFTDSLAGSWLALVKDRFASHVCQTLLTVAAETVTRETHGIISSAPSSQDKGQLLTMTQLIINACEDLMPEFTGLIHNPFASHVVRALLLLLAPGRFMSPESRPRKHAPTARSKKSAMWKARRGPMKPLILDELHIAQLHRDGTTKLADLTTPKDFEMIARKFLDRFRNVLNSNEVRALAVDKVASPVLQMLLELEAAFGQADTTDSIMDHLLAGLVTASSPVDSTPSSYVSALFLDATSSHLAESILTRCSSRVFNRVWDRYFSSDLPRLVMHPVANYVVARGIARLDVAQLKHTIELLDGTWSKTLKSSRIGVLTAIADRAGELGAHEAIVVEIICSMFGVASGIERMPLVPCVLRLKPISEYQDALAQVKMRQDDNCKALGESQSLGDGSRYIQDQDSLEPKIQGSILLQSMLRLHEPHNNIVLESIYMLLPAELLAIACHATTSRIFDAAFESTTVSLRCRKRLVTSFMGQFHLLVDDRIGSRVADRCWGAADPYLKEKIARSLIPHEQFLAGSHFGRFFARSLALPLLRRNPDQWRAMHSTERGLPLASGPSLQPSQNPRSVHVVESHLPEPRGSSKRKRKEKHGEDEIDALFSEVGAKKRSKGITAGHEVTINVNSHADLDMTVLEAIKSAPGDTRRKKK